MKCLEDIMWHSYRFAQLATSVSTLFDPKYIMSHMATVFNKFSHFLFCLESLLSGVLLCQRIVNRQYVVPKLFYLPPRILEMDLPSAATFGK